ncbi:MAG: 3-isopropylmalate dehydrogenase [Acidobacteria bacterium]|nr:3-isopropylmalate dehydrogenase [Acidobacteriota bacterium]
MSNRMKVIVLAGDGIGPEVTREAISVLTEVASAFGFEIETEDHLIGGIAIREKGSPFPEETRNACLESDAVFLGAVGTPEFDHLPPHERPEIGLLALRKALGGFANLRPSKAVPALIDSSPLRREIFEGTDLLIVRELLGGLYFGTPRGFEENRTGGYNTMRYSVEEIERVARVAFESALVRRKKVTSVDKANVLETSQIWRETVSRVAKDYPDVELEHLFVDACAMHLVTGPTQFDVILTENLFGDILSDEAAVLTGSLGMLASATIGSNIGLYEPVHGSAPQIAGKNIANPLGTIASAALLLRYSAKNEAAAAAIEDAIETVLDEGYRTADIATENCRQLVSTEEMGRLVCERAVANAGIKTASHTV